VDRDRSKFWPLLGAVLLAVMVRVPVAAWRVDSLGDDRDHYRLLADGLIEGNGLVHPDHGTPTAYRPPLYPLVLAAVAWTTGAGDLGVAALHLALGLATVAGTWLVAIRLGLGRRAWLPAVAVAVDPLLVVGATLPMTETLFAALATWMLALTTSRLSVTRGLVAGILFGLAALCRPSVWAFAVLVVVALGIRWLRKTGAGHGPTDRMVVAVTLAGAALTVSPWLVRNLAVSGTPVLTTTHGGYTLLLGNNPVFYEQVVRQPLGTTWNDTSSDAGRRPTEWRKHLETRMPAVPRGIDAERQRDTFMYRLAVANITHDPPGFARACLLRVLRFWTPWPLESAPGSAWPALIKWCVAAWYATVLAAMLVGIWRAPWRTNSGWHAPLLFLLALSLVHVAFWSTMRMRAPIMPVVFLLATVGTWTPTVKADPLDDAPPEGY